MRAATSYENRLADLREQDTLLKRLRTCETSGTPAAALSGQPADKGLQNKAIEQSDSGMKQIDANSVRTK